VDKNLPSSVLLNWASAYPLNRTVCIDSLRGTEPKSRRLEGYLKAKAKLDPTLEKYKKLSVWPDILQYAKDSELINSGDPTDSQFIDLVGKNLKTRTSVLDMCKSFNLNRR
jgi:hypothetical protein